MGALVKGGFQNRESKLASSERVGMQRGCQALDSMHERAFRTEDLQAADKVMMERIAVILAGQTI